MTVTVTEKNNQVEKYPLKFFSKYACNRQITGRIIMVMTKKINNINYFLSGIPVIRYAHMHASTD